MNLNQITAYIGANAARRGGLAFLVKELGKEDRYDYYVVFMLFDLDNKEIRFDKPEPYENESVYKYNYFGNNPGQSVQYYLCRDMNSVRYLAGSVLSNLTLFLQKHHMSELKLYGLLQEMSEAEMIKLSDKLGEGEINLDKLLYIKKHGFTNVSLTADKRAVRVFNIEGIEEKINFETIIRDDLNDTAKTNRYAIVVPCIIKDGKNINMSNHPDYVEVVEKEVSGMQLTKGKKGKRAKMCYICGQSKEDVSYEFTRKFNQSRINKIYTTTTINTAPSFMRKNYDQVYSICKDCYNNLLIGEKEVFDKFHGQVAGERVFIVPEAIEEDFDYNNLQKIKEKIDWAFASKDANIWISQLANEVELMENLFYTVNFVIYRTDGKSVSVLQVIEDVPVLRFTKVIETIGKNKERIRDHLKFMSLGSIYTIIPVRSNKKKEQVDIGRVLTLYKTLLTGGVVRSEVFYSYGIEALDKGLRQLAKGGFDNYYNMYLSSYRDGKEDFFIKKIVMSYLVLMATCRELGIISDKVEGVFEGGKKLKMAYAPGIEKSIDRMEQFLDGQRFGKESRSLFYLGSLINRVAVAQLKKEHRTKPILKKINYQGMNNREVYRLYNDVVEKLRQYDKMTLYAEALMNKFHEYAGMVIVEGDWPLSEQANVFFIMSGYAYMVGSRPPDIDKEEIEVLEDISEEVENNDNKEQ